MKNIQPKPPHAAMGICFSWNDRFLSASEDIQVEINHYADLFGVKSRKKGIVEAVRANESVNCRLMLNNTSQDWRLITRIGSVASLVNKI